jgi:hypothetical protein
MPIMLEIMGSPGTRAQENPTEGVFMRMKFGILYLSRNDAANQCGAFNAVSD